MQKDRHTNTLRFNSHFPGEPGWWPPWFTFSIYSWTVHPFETGLNFPCHLSYNPTKSSSGIPSNFFNFQCHTTFDVQHVQTISIYSSWSSNWLVPILTVPEFFTSLSLVQFKDRQNDRNQQITETSSSVDINRYRISCTDPSVNTIRTKYITENSENNNNKMKW